MAWEIQYREREKERTIELNLGVRDIRKRARTDTRHRVRESIEEINRKRESDRKRRNRV